MPSILFIIFLFFICYVYWDYRKVLKNDHKNKDIDKAENDDEKDKKD